MARQLSGKNGVQISGGGGAGGDGITFVSVPDIQGGSRVAIGRQNEFSLSALCLLANARVLWFTVEATGGVIGGTFPATLAEDGNNIANVRITVPAGTQVGATIHITVTARDNYGNESLPAEITVTAAEGYVAAPVLSAPLPDTDVSPTSFYAVTSQFSVLGDADSQVAAQYRVVTNNEASEVLYDSGELIDSKEFTRHNIRLVDIPTIRIPILVQARHKGVANGWSDYSAPIACFTTPNMLVVTGSQCFSTSVDFETMNNFSATGYTLPSKTRIYNMYEFGDTYIALTQLNGYWQVFTSTNLSEWSGPYAVDVIANFENPYFGEFNGHLFLSGKHVARSSDGGKTWTNIAGAGTNTAYNSGSFCSNEKYCYYVTSYSYTSSTATSTVFRSSDGLTFTSKQVVNSTTDWYEALWGIGAALGNGLVIFSSRRGTHAYVSNNDGETYNRIVIPSGSFQTNSYNNHVIFRFKGDLYAVFSDRITKGAIDGLTWDTPTVLNSGYIKGISVNETKVRFFGAVHKGTANIKESTDMESWAVIGKAPTLLRMDDYGYLRTKSGEDILFNGSYFRSKDSATWKSMIGFDISSNIDNIHWYDSCYAFGKFFRVGGDDSAGNKGLVSTSIDGVTWDAPITVCPSTLRKVKYDGRYVIASSEGSHIAYSPKGEGAWTGLNLPGKFEAGGGAYVRVISWGADVLYSYDLITWLKASAPNTSSAVSGIGGMQFGEDRFLCTMYTNPSSYNYDMYTSYSLGTGSSWSSPLALTIDSSYINIFSSTPITAFGNSVFVYAIGKFVVVFDKSGRVKGSVTFLESQQANSICFVQGKFYIGFTDGSIVSAVDGLKWDISAVQVLPFYPHGARPVIMSNV